MLLFPLILSPLFTLLFSASLIATSPNAVCPPSACGNSTLQVPYPFWFPPQDPSSPVCGYPHFMLFCQNNITSLALPSAGIYTLTAINASSQTLSLVDTAATSDPTCLRPSYNLSVSASYYNSALSFTAEDTQLFFYYNCTKEHNGAAPLGCGGGGDGIYSYVLTSDMAVLPGYCEECLVAPVMHEVVVGGGGLMNGGLVGIVEKGFQLGWETGGGGSDNCRRCENSGGGCGQVENDFICFCENGLSEIECKNGSYGECQNEGYEGFQFATGFGHCP